MAIKSEVIIIRVDSETKRRIEQAAESQGLTITSFVLRAAEKAAAAAAKTRAAPAARSRRPKRTAKGNVSQACPTYFRATCFEASRGGAAGYRWAGRKLMGTVDYVLAWDTDQERAAKLEELADLAGASDDDGVLGWFDRELPRCMALIPRRRRRLFLAGVYEEIAEKGVV
jgi:hypothetical protein